MQFSKWPKSKMAAKPTARVCGGEGRTGASWDRGADAKQTKLWWRGFSGTFKMTVPPPPLVSSTFGGPLLSNRWSDQLAVWCVGCGKVSSLCVVHRHGLSRCASFSCVFPDSRQNYGSVSRRRRCVCVVCTHPILQSRLQAFRR